MSLILPSSCRRIAAIILPAIYHGVTRQRQRRDRDMDMNTDRDIDRGIHVDNYNFLILTKILSEKGKTC